jgi:potassium efflux system protein
MSAISKLSKIFILFLVTFCINFIPAQAKSTIANTQLVEYLRQEKSNLKIAIQAIKAAKLPLNQADYLKTVQENNATLALNKAKIASFQSFMVNQKKLQLDFSQRIKQLQQLHPSSLPKIGSSQKIEKVTVLTDINKNTITLINENIALATRYNDLLLSQRDSLTLWQSKIKLHDRLSNLREQEDKLTDKLQAFFESSLKIQQEIKASLGFKSAYLLEAKLLLNNQLINLTQYKIAELNIQRKLARTDFLLLKNPNIRTLQTVTDSYKRIINQLSEMEQALKKIVTMLKNEQPHLIDQNLKQEFNSLIRVINTRITGIVIQQQTLQEDLENHQSELKKQLSVRQSLAEYSIDSWPEISSEVSQVPMQFYNYLKSLFLKAKDNYVWQDSITSAFMWVGAFLIPLFGIWLQFLLKKIGWNKERSRLSGHLYDTALTLFSRNLPYITGAGILFFLLNFTQVPFINYQMLLNLLMVWLTFRTLILIARISLLERINDSSGKDVKFYYRIRWVLVLGGWVTALMVFSIQLPLPILLQDIFNRLFMMLLLMISVLAWISRGVIGHLLTPILQTKKRYIQNVVMLLTVLVPLTVFIIALIGLIGYVNLAWSLSRYQIQILLVVISFILMRGLLFDALELISEWMICSLNNGWLWIEVFLKPIDKILKTLLFLASIYVLFQLFDWHSDSWVAIKLIQLSKYALVDMSGIHITIISILEFAVLFWLLLWVSKWTREFAYRWLYKNAKDTGVRNSLSVFTQYAVILIGGLITLRVLGLDFSGMSMVIGGLAVGMGFGLRDFASNIVGGLMLLIERPVREGDLITLGNHEGRVAHIGIRSMRVSSWDNMEVLIPNAETFNKPFTNWTHQDDIVRTVIPIKVSRADDPIIIQQLIFDVLAIIPEIVPEPAPQVFLTQIDEALIEFEVRYFINVQTHTRFEIRSKVLFAITAQFKAAGIKAPIPPISVELKEKEDEQGKRYIQKTLEQYE